MPKIVDYELKKKEIVEKAREVFTKYGYINTNLSHISNQCGMGRTTIYQYFSNKDEIFYHTMSHTLENMRTQVRAIAIDEGLTFIDKLKKIVHQLIEESSNNHTFLLLLETWLILKRERNETLEKLKDYIQELKSILEELIKEGIEAKEIKEVDSRSLAETIYTLIETFTLQRTSNILDLNKKLESFNILIDGLKA
ncbi:TetR/AcrR family transcriptional regulator [Tepidimicrobium xylanilyticum]|uniref:Transcriptional regulator, TetR family n=1 Tax=Tepidimicrobium xylanilyticum TaxID=1123352 RepID=A0A1H2TZY9_9FIRM|nr:TetR/AcrR family transcriptional regulator [Tepidimicrobium xylanilyticum]GMG98054.1 TetR family transcriptional regulator [Tepidimicrobium xylanilyticum]SDW48879.1 transcriptional regulator, TetR family [Tepidimicrobium xylanilyticum]